MTRNSPKWLLAEVIAIMIISVLSDNGLIAMVVQDSPIEMSKRPADVERSLATIRSFFSELSGKRFAIDKKWIDESGIVHETVSETTHAEIHTYKLARFYSEKDVRRANTQAGTYRLHREWLYHPNGQWLQAQQKVFADGRKTLVGIGGIRDWRTNRPSNMRHLILLGYVWGNDGYVNLNDPALTKKVEVELRRNELTIGSEPNSFIRILLNEKLSSLKSLSYSVPATLPSRKGEFDNFELKFHFDESGSLEHYEKRMAGSNSEGVGYFLRDFEGIDNRKTLVEFKNVKVESDHLVDIFYDPNQTKEYYRSGHFWPAGNNDRAKSRIR